jgi:hypothetical protein
MEYDQINHDTSALDAAMKTARDRDRMAAQAALNGSRGTLLLKGVPVTAIAGLAFIGAASSAAWIMRPHFDFRTINIDVPKFAEKEVLVPKLVEKEVDAPKLVERPIEVPKLVERGVFIPKLVERPAETSPAPGPSSDATSLPPKTPDRAEQKFINRPGYRSASIKGRIVKSFDDDLHFDTGDSFFPSHMDANGLYVRSEDRRIDSDPFVGDYGYCNVDPSKSDKQLVFCFVIHNDVVQPLLRPAQGEAGMTRPLSTQGPRASSSRRLANAGRCRRTAITGKADRLTAYWLRL